MRDGVKTRYMVIYRKHDPGEYNVTHQDLFLTHWKLQFPMKFQALRLTRAGRARGRQRTVWMNCLEFRKNKTIAVDERP